MKNKFRVWDKQEKKWLKYFFISQDGKLCTISDNPLVSYTILPPHRYIIQRYTEVTNKNNIDIYEGDLVQFQSIVGFVRWVDNGWEVIRPVEDSNEGIIMEGEPLTKNYDVFGSMWEERK